jgi:hypothetical protein
MKETAMIDMHYLAALGRRCRPLGVCERRRGACQHGQGGRQF